MHELHSINPTEKISYFSFTELRPAYFKAEVNYFLSQTSENISSLQVAANSIGIDLIATSVMELEALGTLKTRKINMIQGRATEMLG